MVPGELGVGQRPLGGGLEGSRGKEGRKEGGEEGGEEGGGGMCSLFWCDRERLRWCSVAVVALLSLA